MSRTMKDSGIPWIGEIPERWKVVRNKNVFSTSKTFVGEMWNNTQLLSLTTKGIKPVAIGSTSGKVPDSYETYQVVEKDNLVMCLFDLDCSAVFSGLSPICGMISPAYKVLTIKNGYYPDFYAKWFEYIFEGRKFMFLSKNIRYSLTYDEFAALQIVAPPLAEQHLIATFLDKKCSEIDSLIDLQEQMIEELKAYKQSLITEAVTKGIRNEELGVRNYKDSGIEWIGDVPEEWEVIKIKYLLSERKERSFKGDEEPLSMSQKYGLIPTKEMDVIPNMASSFEGAKIVYVNDLVFNKLKAHLGVFSTSRYNGLVSPDYAVYYGTGKAIMPFMEFMFKTPQYISEFCKTATGVGSGLTRLYTSDLFAMLFPLPSIKEQEEIVSYLETKRMQIDELIIIKQQKIESLKEYKKSVIYEYVTGKKEP